MNNMKYALIYTVHIPIILISLLAKFLGTIDDIVTEWFVKYVIGAVENYVVRFDQRCDKVSFLQKGRNLLVFVIKLLALTSYWPMTGLIGFLNWIAGMISEDAKSAIYQVTRRMLYIFIVWSLIRPLYVFPNNLTVLGVVIIGFNPVRASCTCLFYKLIHEQIIFIGKTPEEYVIEKQEEEERLEVYGEDDD